MIRLGPSGPLRGGLRPPPDKSISHRAAILAAMGEGEARIDGYLDAADTRSTLAAIELLGAAVEDHGPAAEFPGGIDLTVQGVGMRGPGEKVPAEALAFDVGNAGTLLRLLPGWLAGQGRGVWTLDGDDSIRRRPVDRVVEPLRMMGAAVECRDDRLPPLRVEGAELRGITYRMPVASAQVKSCVLLAGLLAAGRTEAIEPATTRDHTERMLAAAGVAVESEDLKAVPLGSSGPARRVKVEGPATVEPRDLTLPADFSSAAFWLVAALVVPGSEVRLYGVGLNPTRVGLLGILNRMGAAIEIEEGPDDAVEPHGEIVARASPLQGTRVVAAEVPVTIDELPLVAVAACFAEGGTRVTGAEELRHKESDRIAAVVEGLRGLGAEIDALEDGFVVRGTGGLRGGRLDARGDHRMAMLGAIAGLASREGVEVEGIEAAEVSYPGFTRDLSSLIAR